MSRGPRTADTPPWEAQDPDLRQLWNDGWESEVIAAGLGRSKIAVEVRAARIGLPKRSAGLRLAQERTQRRVDRCFVCGLCCGRQAHVDRPGHRPDRPLLPNEAGYRTCLPCLSNGKKTVFWSPGGGVRRCPQCENDPSYGGLSWLEGGVGRF